MPNTLRGLKPKQASRPASSLADLQRSLDDASDARDIAKEVLRLHPEGITDEEEITARFDIPRAPPLPEIHVHMHSEPDIEKPSEPPAKKVRAGLVAVGSGIGVAILTGVAALLQNCGHR